MKMKKCPSCGEDNLPRSVFCCMCGKRFPAGENKKTLETFFELTERELADFAPAKPKSSPAEDFKIENGVLRTYIGHDRNIVIPNGVTNIGDSAFYNCQLLMHVTVPEGVKSIGKIAFAYCSHLKSITLPKSLTSIGARAFDSCTSLTDINIPEGVKNIEDESFYNCEALKSVTIHEGVTIIGDSAFVWCAALESVTFPRSVTKIGKNVFRFNHFLICKCPAGSYAEKYCKTYRINYTTIG